MSELNSYQSGKSIKFSRAAGFYFLNGHIFGYVPEFFEIQNARIIGAVRYNNVWKGIRFVYDK